MDRVITPFTGYIMTEKINPTACPFCKQDNQCAVVNQQGCWCNKVEVPSELIKLIPEVLIGKSCICNTCINRFNNDPQGFLEQIKSNMNATH